jgi:hypothetical protein
MFFHAPGLERLKPIKGKELRAMMALSVEVR